MFDPKELKICMFGARGVGKTTVMVSIFKDSQSGLAGSQVYMRNSDAASGQLVDLSHKLELAIEQKNPGALPATSVPADYIFEIGVLGNSKPVVKLRVKDFPGEYIEPDALPSKKEELKSFIKESTIILVAIDTPSMMEEGGRYNEQRNKTKIVIDYLNNNLGDFRDRLVMFIPLRCERYVYDGRIAEVSRRVRELYEGALKPKFLENNVASCIVPILTLGGMEFDCMVDRNIGGVPTKAPKFRIYEPMPKYMPSYCAQPVYYLLTYIAEYYDWMKEHASFFERMKNFCFGIITKDQAFNREIHGMRKHMIVHEPGFETITSNTLFKI